jgi:hypothetical protein
MNLIFRDLGWFVIAEVYKWKYHSVVARARHFVQGKLSVRKDRRRGHRRYREDVASFLSALNWPHAARISCPREMRIKAGICLRASIS